VRTTLTEAEASFVRWARVARFATVAPDGSPHVVPVCPVLDGDRLLIASDDNAKVRNIRLNPRVAIVFDEYVEDWDRNMQVALWGTARLIEGGREWERGKELLDEKFRQYEPLYPIKPGGSLIVEVRIERVASEGL
jgi:PPOX class probable F420-dependent enzyme